MRKQGNNTLVSAIFPKEGKLIRKGNGVENILEKNAKKTEN